MYIVHFVKAGAGLARDSLCAALLPIPQLYPLDRGFFYIHKPPLLIPDTEIESVEFARQVGGGPSMLLSAVKSAHAAFVARIALLLFVCADLTYGR